MICDQLLFLGFVFKSSSFALAHQWKWLLNKAKELEPNASVVVLQSWRQPSWEILLRKKTTITFFTSQSVLLDANEDTNIIDCSVIFFEVNALMHQF